MKRFPLLHLIIFLTVVASVAKEPDLPKSFAWTIDPTLGTRLPADMDTSYINYAQKYVPADQTVAFATTGNYGGPGETLIFFERQYADNFFFLNSVDRWLPSPETFKFYNTRIPMTLLSYNFGGSKVNSQDRLHADFSGNINSRAQVGALIDYLHSKGMYANQAAKDLSWGFNGSYFGERFQWQGMYYHFNYATRDNGGITDDRYITDPGELQGGNTNIDVRNIPTNLTSAQTKLRGGRLLSNAQYHLGYYYEKAIDDSTSVDCFQPVSSIFWTLDYLDAKHGFVNKNSQNDRDFWQNTYLVNGSTNDRSSYWSLTNVAGISLHEGFHKYAPMGLAVYLKHTYRHITQMRDTLDQLALPPGIDALPFSPDDIKEKTGENHIWIGAQLSRRNGRILNYQADAEIGVVGGSAGEVTLSGDITTNIPLFGDTMSIQAAAKFTNLTPPLLYERYLSNHFAWNNDFSMTRRLRIGGGISYPKTGTAIDVGVENMQNYIYFNSLALPTQHRGNVSVFHAALNQDIRLGPVTWANRLIFQTSSNQTVVPLPKFAVYSNLYVTFRVARVLYVQAGIDCDYYTSYKSVAYQPATMVFYNQDEAQCGNYPFMNLYVNMKLKRTHFYLMFSHINQGLTGNNYFSMPGYPLNPRKFQLGIAIDFMN